MEGGGWGLGMYKSARGLSECVTLLAGGKSSGFELCRTLGLPLFWDEGSETLAFGLSL